MVFPTIAGSNVRQQRQIVTAAGGFDPGQPIDGSHLHSTGGVARQCASASCGADSATSGGNIAGTVTARAV